MNGLQKIIIIRYSTHGEHKSAVVDRFNRTLKTIMWKRFTAENTRHWIDMLDKLLTQYNNKKHSMITMTPAGASHKDPLKFDKQPTFSVGDQVRISRIKGIFEKGYLPNWSKALYTVHEVKIADPITYILKDMNGEIIKGGFYTEELQNSYKKFLELKRSYARRLMVLNTVL